MLSRRGLLSLALVVALCPSAYANQTEIPSNIQITGTPAFVTQTQTALRRLMATPVGAALVAEIGRTPHATTITEISDPNGWSRAHSAAANLRVDGRSPGPGSDTTIGWNPNYAPGVPAEIILAHELIHTLHAMQGRRDPLRLNAPSNPDHDIRQEELRTVGVAGFNQNAITENTIRDSWNATYGTSIPDRVTYRGPVRTGIVPPPAQSGAGSRPSPGARGVLQTIFGGR